MRQNKKSIPLQLTVLLLGLVLSGCSTLPQSFPLAKQKKSQPNILFILTDDLRYDALGTYGNPSVSTPHMDKLANQGMQLNRFYVASPVCHASRASFLTGLYPHQKGIDHKFPMSIPSETPTVASLLRNTDYVTGFIGKAHPKGPPKEWGFDKAPAFKQPRTKTFIEAKGETTIVENNTTPYLVDHSSHFIRKHQEKPWFLWLATNSPHSEYIYNNEHPYKLPDDYKFKGPPGFSPNELKNISDTFIENRPKLKGFLTNLWRNYYSEISTLDQQIGRILKVLKETNQAQNTFILLTSDNGIMHGSHGVLFKSTWYEEATRVPAIVRWPGRVQPGSESNSLVSSVDFIHTVLDLTVQRASTKGEGRSFLPVVKQHQSTRQYVYSEGKREIQNTETRWSMVRGNRFKLVQLEGLDTKYLYDLLTDKHERNNLAGDQTFQAVQDKLEKRIRRWSSNTP